MNGFAYFCGRTENIYSFERFRKLLYRMNSLYILSVQFSWLGYLNARAPPKQEATFILVQIPLSLLLQKGVFPLVVHNSYMVADPSD